jgi:hypothetical protein
VSTTGRQQTGCAMTARRFTAVDLDRLLATRTKLPPELRDALHALIPEVLGAGFADQQQAATADSTRLLNRLADYQGDTVIAGRLDTLDDWLRLGLLDTVCAWHAGEARTCLHDPHPLKPQPVWAAAWRPRLVACLHCLHLLKVPTQQADKTCDLCGRVVAGLEADDGIYPIVVQYANLTYQAGACSYCEPAYNRRARISTAEGGVSA